MQPIAVRVPTPEFTILPAGCLHWPIGEKDLLQRWVEEMKQPKHYGILMGDSLDLARTTYRKHIRGYQGDENSQDQLDDYARHEVEKLAMVLQPVREKLWGIVQGNHYWEFMDGTNSEQYLCQLLKIPYMGAMGLFRVTSPTAAPSGRDAKGSITIYAHHTGGTCGGRTIGGDVNALVRQESAWDVDIYLLGHTHRRIAFKEPVMRLSHRGVPKVIERSKVFARTGAFLKSFKEKKVPVDQRHAPSYAEKAAYRPTDLGWVTINVKWRALGSHGSNTRVPEYRLSY
jgi:hypothetical protein